MVLEVYALNETLMLMKIVLAIIIGMMLAIIIALRVVVVSARRLERLEINIARITKKVLQDEELELKKLGVKKTTSGSMKSKKKSSKKSKSKR